MRHVWMVLLLVSALGFSQETAENLREQGLALLKEAQATPDKIVDAAKLLAQAADAFTAQGKEPQAEEMNSALYWCKKKMNMAQIDAFLSKGNGVAKATVAKMEAIEKKEVKQEDAGAWLAKADKYAETATDPFLSAVRYFEVASRFKGTPEGEQALEKSLKFLQGAKVAQNPTTIVGQAEKGDGKVYVQSNPSGASILVEAEDGLRDTGARTPSLVQLPKGNATLVLRKDKYEDLKLPVQIGDAIVKTEVAKLSFPKMDVEIVSAEAGWRVFLLDGTKLVSLCDKTGKAAVSPCTISLEEGNKTLVLAKDGFMDQSKRLAVGKDQIVNFDQKGRVGGSKAIAWEKANGPKAQILGKWNWTKEDGKGTLEFLADGTVISRHEKGWTSKGSWSVSGFDVKIVFDNKTLLGRLDGNSIVGTDRELKR